MAAKTKRMNKIIEKLFFWYKRDELFGKWSTEDGSGFSIIMGSLIEFKKDGNGKYESWSNNDDQTEYKLNGEINWIRKGKNTIEIIDIKNSERTQIEYKLTLTNNRIELSNLNNKKVGKIELEGFWFFSQVMFKIK